MAMFICLLSLAAALALTVGCAVLLRRRLDDPIRAGKTVLASLAAAALLFWFILTAIQRRVFGFGELFRFFGEGSALPGRAALFLVCAAACLFFGATGSGERLRAKLRELTRKNGILWLFSLAVTALFFLWAFRISVVRFMTNDDTYLLRTVARTGQTGLQAAQGSFSTVLFCWLLGLFYRIDPEGWWYALYHLAVIFSSGVIVGRCIYGKVRTLGWAPLWGCLIHIVVLCTAYLMPLIRLSFTVTPALAGTAAAALLLCRDELAARGGRIASDAGTVLLTLLCYLQRRSTGRALFCFIALAFAYQLVKLLLSKREDRVRRLAGLLAGLAAMLALLGVCRGANNAMTDSATGGTTDAYQTAEYYRSVVMDYLSTQLTVEQTEAVGIPQELANLLLRQWFFMDERVNTDTFRELTRLYYHTEETGRDAADLMTRLRSSYADDSFFLPFIRIMTAMGAILALAALCLMLRGGGKRWLEAVCALAALGGAAILCLYLMLEGRFLLRVFLVAAIPAVVMQTLLCLSCAEGAPTEKRAVRVGAAALAAVCAAALCVLGAAEVFRVPYTTEYTDRETTYAAQWKTEAYANEHADLTFITNSFGNNLDPFHGGTYPSNIIRWGGSGVTAQADEDRLYASAFFRDDVRFLCENPGTVMLLMQYLTLDNGPVAALDEAHLTDTIYIFDMRRIAPADGADGWYEWNGKTYYFRDGSALTGTQIIDGETYEFLPAGAASPMFLLSADEGQYYTTMAYTLAASP